MKAVIAVVSVVNGVVVGLAVWTALAVMRHPAAPTPAVCLDGERAT
jgi:hypothetical protein